MDLFKSSNPAFSENIFSKAGAYTSDETMTVQGTMNKALLMLILVILGAAFTWKGFFDAMPVEGAENVALPTSVIVWMLVGGIGGFITSLIVIFAPKTAPYTAPIYAVLEGLFLGGISAFFAMQYSGIVMQAVGLTFITFFIMLTTYRTGLIKVTEKFRTIIIVATAAIALMYFVTFILGFFGVNTGYIHGNGLLSIGISIAVIAIAALNLLLDFDFIDRASAQGAPKYMEWYGAFGLMVTLIWLYIEFLRLLSKLNSRN